MNLSSAARQPIDENIGNSPGLRAIDVNGKTLRAKSLDPSATRPSFSPGYVLLESQAQNPHTSLLLLDRAAPPFLTGNLLL